ncbi:MAG: hypothetical protein R3324_00790, partial [Halobacteriales archaeon]|nr:hypothetical protein [Halobacteriales archaeon]
GGSTAATPDPDLEAEVACPNCDRTVAVAVPDREVEPTPSPYVVAFGDYRTAHCPAGHEFWVYYC